VNETEVLRTSPNTSLGQHDKIDFLSVDPMTWDLTIWQKSKKDASTDSGLGASAQTLVLRRTSDGQVKSTYF